MVLVLLVALIAPVVPLPGFSTELVSAVEPVPMTSWRDSNGAELDEVDDLHLGTEHDHEVGQDRPGSPPEAPAVAGNATGEPDGSHEDPAGDRVIGGSGTVGEFRMIGVEMDEPPAGPVLVRVRDGGVWGEWQQLVLELDEGPDLGSSEAQRGTVGSQPLWVDSADAYEVSLGAEESGAASVMVVREHERTVVVDSSEAGAALPQLSGMHSRSEWGARGPKDTPTIASTVKLAVVHHSVSSNSYSPGQVPSIIRGIQAYHMDGRGWDDIGYNFVVDRYGGIWEGRGGGADRPVVGAHASGFNTASVGVMVLGDFSGVQPTAASIQSVGSVIGWKLALHGAEPSGTVNFVSGGGPKYPAGTAVNLPRVVGHGDVGSTACPGQVRNHLGAIRVRASAVFPFWRALLSPEGAMESVVGGLGTVTVSGWAVDRSAPGPAFVRTAAGTVKRTIATTLARPDIQARYGGDGKAGFNGTISGVPPGMQPVCATVYSSLGSDRNTRLGCTWTLVGDPTGKSPVGRFRYVTTTPGRIQVGGWALDPETSVPVNTELIVDGTVRSSVRADKWSSSLPAQYIGLGRYRQFGTTAVAIPAGTHTVCMRAKNQAAGLDTLVDCRIVTVPAHDPGGRLEIVSSSRKGKVDITGWALDLESTRSVNVLLVVAGKWHVVPANRRRDDIAATYPGYGAAHGLAASVSAPGGPTEVCAYGINLEGGKNSLLGCRTVQVVK